MKDYRREPELPPEHLLRECAARIRVLIQDPFGSMHRNKDWYNEALLFKDMIRVKRQEWDKRWRSKHA